MLTHSRPSDAGRAAHARRLLPDGIERAIDHVCLGGRAHLLYPVAAARSSCRAEVKMSEVNLERALNDPADLFESSRRSGPPSHPYP